MESIHKKLEDSVEKLRLRLEKQLELRKKFDLLYGNLPLDTDDGSEVFLDNEDITAVIYSRELLAQMMSVAPTWEKTYGNDYITYSATVQDVRVKLIACGGALPTTCKLVEVEEVEPAREARVVVRKKLRCVDSEGNQLS